MLCFLHQRSSTLVVASDTLMELGIAPSYSEAAVERGLDHDKVIVCGVMAEE